MGSMTSKYRQSGKSAYFQLFFSALLVLSTIILVQQVATAQSKQFPRREQLFQNNQDDDMSSSQFHPGKKRRGGNSGPDQQFRRQQNDGDTPVGQWRRNAGGQRFGGGAPGDTDMPGWRMRRRFSNDLQGGAEMPARRWSGGGDPGAENTPGRNLQGFNGEGQNAFGKMPFRQNRNNPGAGFPSAGGKQGFRGGQGQGRGPGQGGVFGNKTLDLTPLALNDEQKSRVKQMRQQTRLKIKDLRASMQEKQLNLRKLMFDPDASEAQIREARSQLHKVQDQMDETNMNDLLSIRAMLTPEQRKRLPDCMPGRRATANGGGNAAAEVPAAK